MRTWTLLVAAAPRLELAYQHYATSTRLSEALQQDVVARFTRAGSAPDPHAIITLVIDFLGRAAEARNLPWFTVSPSRGSCTRSSCATGLPKSSAGWKHVWDRDVQSRRISARA